MNAETTTHAEGGLNATELAAALTVRDLGTSTAWYRDILGCAIDRRHERDGRPIAVTLRAGQVKLLLTQDDGARGLDRSKGEGFSLRLTTPQDIDALAAQIQSRGGTLETGPLSAFGARIFRICDPDGFRFTISSPQVT